MGCGASVANTAPAIFCGCRRADAATTMILDRAYARSFRKSTKPIKAAKSSAAAASKASCLRGFRLNRREPSKLSLMDERLSPTEPRSRRRRFVDPRFIEERIRADSSASGSTTDDAATNSTTMTRLSSADNERSAFRRRNVVSPVGAVQSNGRRSFFRIAMDYNRRLKELETMRTTRKPEPKPIPLGNGSTMSTPREAAILQHVSRREFLENSASHAPSPTLSHNQRPSVITRNSIHGSKDTLTSEKSFVVVHSTLKVAWEKELYHEKIQEQQSRRRRGAQFRWHSVDSTCTETSGESFEETSERPNDKWKEWNRQRNEIVALEC